jgi:hopanoid biosynthesis associated protein HpnK
MISALNVRHLSKSALPTRPQTQLTPPAPLLHLIDSPVVPRLIVNADDFGLTSGVNRAILELHNAGVLTSASLMARARATEEAIEIARSTPTLGVGCHVVLVDGTPILSAKNQIASLADPRSDRFRPGLGSFLIGLDLASGRKQFRQQIEAETRAQIEFLQDKGVTLTHIDTHKHTHMFPSVLRPVLRAARACGIRTIRNPFEPAWAVHATHRAPWMRIAEVSALRWLAPICQRIIVEEGFTTTDGTIAVAATGVLDADTLSSLARKLPSGTWELVTHPGYNDDDLAQVRTRLRSSRDLERKALPVLRDFPGVELISYAGLTGP